MLLISRPPDIALPTGHDYKAPRIRRIPGTRRHLTPDLSAERPTRPPISPALGLCVLLGLLLLAALLLSGGAVNAQETEPADLGYDEEEALSIDRILICPVCPAETIDQAQVELSRQMRRIVREMLAQGASREEILDFFVERYGPEVLAAPPRSGFNLLAWVVPAAGVLAGVVAVPLIIWSMARRGRPMAAGEPLMENDLEPYLEAVDRDLAASERGLALPEQEDSESPDAEPPDDETRDEYGTRVNG